MRVWALVAVGIASAAWLAPAARAEDTIATAKSAAAAVGDAKPGEATGIAPDDGRDESDGPGADAKPAPSAAPSTPPAAPAPAQIAAPAPVVPDHAVIGLARQKLAGLGGEPAPGDLADRAALAAYWDAHRGAAPLWVDDAGLSKKAASAMAEIGRAADWGLEAADFKLPASMPAKPDQSTLADAEVTLSLAVLKYARFARGGRIYEPAKQLSSYLDRKPPLLDPTIVLEAVAARADVDAYLRSLQPTHAGFERLRQKYLAVRGPAGPDGPIRIPGRQTLTPGKSDPAVAVLRTRLGIAAPSNAGADFYDPQLAEAVIAYQKSKGIRPANGNVDGRTRQMLNRTERGNLKQLVANMEQWRWMPEDLGKFYIWNNIPEFMMRMVKDGRVIHSERIVIGLRSKQTPVFSDEMIRITLRPKWKVPESIKVNEIWPNLVHGGGSLMRKHNLRVNMEGVDVDWRAVDWRTADKRKYFFYRPPGGSNELGNVKFHFPSKHYVFMHDTPDKYMFAHVRRAYSHGCMRVRNPLKFAEILLHEDHIMERPQIDELVRNGPLDNAIDLKTKVPIHLTYFTAMVDEAGNLTTFPDVYGHEKRIGQALAGQWERIDTGRDHLAPIDYEKPAAVAYSTRRRERAVSKEPNFQTFLNNAFGGF